VCGHALIRMYETGAWYLACIYCPHRILEGWATPPVAQDVELPVTPIHPEETEVVA